jgi:DNA-binding MarR family transcriptional regulator
VETSVSSQDKAIAVGAAMRRLTAEIDGLDQRAANRFGINRSDLRCLDVLRGLGPTTPTTLAGAVGMTTGGLSLALDRLETAGYVTRRPNANDGRSVIVEPTEHLAHVEREIFGPLARGMGEIIARYRDADLEVIRDFLDRVADAAARAGRSPRELASSPRLHYDDDILTRARTQAKDT